MHYDHCVKTEERETTEVLKLVDSKSIESTKELQIFRNSKVDFIMENEMKERKV